MLRFVVYHEVLHLIEIAYFLGELGLANRPSFLRYVSSDVLLLQDGLSLEG